jgi:hypothetical protein
MKIKFISILFLFNFSFILNSKLYDPQSLYMDTVNALGSLSPYNFIYNPNNINLGMGNMNQLKAIQDYLFNFYGVSTFFVLIDSVGSDYLSTNGLTKFIAEYMYYYENSFNINDDLTVTVLFLYDSQFGQIQSIRAGNYLTSLLGGTYKLNQLLEEQYVNIQTYNYLQAIFSILIKIRNSIELAGQNN